jgi:hypothetical protein
MVLSQGGPPFPFNVPMVDTLPAIKVKGATTLTDANPRTGYPALKWVKVH